VGLSIELGITHILLPHLLHRCALAFSLYLRNFSLILGVLSVLACLASLRFLFSGTSSQELTKQTHSSRLRDNKLTADSPTLRLNRYSMPVTRSRTYLGDIGLEDSNNTTGFLFGDEDSNSGETRTTPTAQTNSTTDPFPTLFRQQQGFSNLVSCAPPFPRLLQHETSRFPSFCFPRLFFSPVPETRAGHKKFNSRGPCGVVWPEVVRLVFFSVVVCGVYSGNKPVPRQSRKWIIRANCFPLSFIHPFAICHSPVPSHPPTLIQPSKQEARRAHNLSCKFFTLPNSLHNFLPVCSF